MAAANFFPLILNWLQDERATFPLILNWLQDERATFPLILNWLKDGHWRGQPHPPTLQRSSG